MISVGIIITARLKSTRLPRKVLKPLSGKPMLKYLVDRMKLVKLSKKVIINTSTNSQDNDLVDFAKSENIKFYRGHEDDVLQRMLDCAKYFNLDYILSVTADNPWTCPYWADKLLSKLIRNKSDFGKIEGLPFGTFSYALKTNAVKKACKIKNEIDTEVWGEYFNPRFGFKNYLLHVPNDLKEHRPDLRLTVDTKEDFSLASYIAEEFKNNTVCSLTDIIDFLEKNPDIAKINSMITQKIGKAIKVKFNSTKVV